MRGVILTILATCLAFSSSDSSCGLKAPIIIPTYKLPAGNLLTGIQCRTRNRTLEATCDPTIVREQAVQMICDENLGPYNLAQVCDIFDYLQTNWGYVSDPYRAEFFATAEESLRHFRGDCDDFSIALATCIRAVGGLTRIVAAYDFEGGHAYAQVCLGSTNLLEIERYLQARYPENGSDFEYCVQVDKWGNRWLNLDSRHLSPGGPLAKSNHGYQFILGHPEYCLDLGD